MLRHGKIVFGDRAPGALTGLVRRKAGVGPVDEERLSDDAVSIHEPPEPAVVAVVAIVTHDKKLSLGNGGGAEVVPRINTVGDGVYFVRLLHQGAVQKQDFVSDFDLIAGYADHPFHERSRHSCLRWRPKRNDVSAIDLPAGQPAAQLFGKVAREGDLVEKEMIADENRGDHRRCRDLRRLCDECREDQNENDGAGKAFRPLPHLTGLAHHLRAVDLEVFKTDVGSDEPLELFDSYVRDAGDFNGTFFHMASASPASPSPFDSRATHPLSSPPDAPASPSSLSPCLS